MLYLERIPASPLSRFVQVLWYSRAPVAGHRYERILPTGCAQVILNLERDCLHDCLEGSPDQQVAPSLVVGGRSTYEIIAARDMISLIGISFKPGGFAAFAGDAADRFSNLSIPLDAAWGRPALTLRSRLRETDDVRTRFRIIEAFLLERLAACATPRNAARRQLVEFALSNFGSAPALSTVREVARSTGLSERRFSQIFREEVGLSPKVWCRVRRFQRAVRMLHLGVDLPWSDLALDCGFYDQSHFANEFRAFSGVDATTYSSRRTRWANHIAAG
ncbi:MAG: helix-turn-helix domain-containing protein [Terracidiphilus sp.]